MSDDPLTLRFECPSWWPKNAEYVEFPVTCDPPVSVEFTMHFGGFADIALAPGPPELEGQEAATIRFEDGSTAVVHTLATDGRLGRYIDQGAP